MSTDLETFLANVQKVIRDKGSAEIGGGVFSYTELRDVNNEIRYLQGRCAELVHDNKLMLEALRQVVDHFTSDALDDPFKESLRRIVNAAYRHVSGT